MNVLGIDTSTAASAACVLRADGEAFDEAPAPERLLERPGHAAELLPAVERALGRAGLGYAELDAVAVGVGPGSFTGLRIGVATARALAHAHGLELRPVSSLAALAAGTGAPLSLPVIDARRKEVFAALHEDGEERWEPWVATPEAVAERVQAGGRSPLAAGDGSLRFRELFQAAGIEVAPDGSQLHVVRALQVCLLGARVPPAAPEAVLPSYLRAPDAIPTDER
jgi:tRNA threonylcarbamoyladenosine biosynthesis protein TsaB